MDWRLLAAITVISWGAYNVVLKAAAGKVAWQVSMLCFVFGYSAFIVVFCLLNASGMKQLFSDIMKSGSWWSILAGVLCGLGAVTFFVGLPKAPGSVYIPLIGLYVVVAAIGCLVFFKEPISARVIVGMICAVAAIVLLGK
jgi:drug/metabolite transporter (DMT)-like permease